MRLVRAGLDRLFEIVWHELPIWDCAGEAHSNATKIERDNDEDWIALMALPTYRPHAPNAANAACGSDLMRWTVCFVRPSTRAMVERLGALALDRADRMRPSCWRV
jgi:hypothetical protein